MSILFLIPGILATIWLGASFLLRNDREPDADEVYWTDELPPETDIILERRLMPELLLIDIGPQDPDEVVAAARADAARCWEITHIEFPRLRAQLAAGTL